MGQVPWALARKWSWTQNLAAMLLCVLNDLFTGDETPICVCDMMSSKFWVDDIFGPISELTRCHIPYLSCRRITYHFEHSNIRNDKHLVVSTLTRETLVCVCVCLCVCVCACACARIIKTNVCVHVCMCACILFCMYVCMCDAPACSCSWLRVMSSAAPAAPESLYRKRWYRTRSKSQRARYRCANTAAWSPISAQKHNHTHARVPVESFNKYLRYFLFGTRRIYLYICA